MPRQPKPWFRKDRKSWFVTIDGQRHNLGPNKRDAFDRFYEMMRQPKATKVASRSLVAVIDLFLDWVAKHRAAATYEWYRSRLQLFVDRYPDLMVDQVRPFHAQEWVDSYPDLSSTTRRNYLRSIKRCLRWAKQQGYVDTNPVADMELPAATSRESCITIYEFEKLLTYVRNDTFRDLLVATWETGCRPQESLRLEARHVDFENQRWVFPVSEAKGKRKPRIVYLTPTALDITRRLVEITPSGLLFRNANGKPWTKDAVNCAFSQLQDRMGREIAREQGLEFSEEEIADFIATLKPTRRVQGVECEKTPAELRHEAKNKLTQRRSRRIAPKYSLYVLRHSWATRALRSGIDSLTVAVLMGHSDPSTLARVYQHLSQDPAHLLAQASKMSE